MKLITRDVDYAIRALCLIAGGEDKLVSAGELVSVLGIPRPFLRKNLQKLHKAGILNACQGHRGGFSLALRPDKIRVVDIISIFQGGFRLNECVFKKQPCPRRATCRLKKQIDAIGRYVARKLAGITIAYLLKG